jgi:hypothetical protein
MRDTFNLNKRLREVYGLTIDGNNRFRVVWSENSYEKRLGDFGKGFEEVKEVKKYSYLSDRYILEAYIPEAKANPEINNSDGFEPIYVFQTKDGQFLEPVEWACEFAIKCWLTEVQKKTDAQLRNEDLEKEAKEVEKIKDALDTSSVDQMKFRYGEAVIHDSSKALVDKTGDK